MEFILRSQTADANRRKGLHVKLFHEHTVGAVVRRCLSVHNKKVRKNMQLRTACMYNILNPIVTRQSCILLFPFLRRLIVAVTRWRKCYFTGIINTLIKGVPNCIKDLVFESAKGFTYQPTLSLYIMVNKYNIVMKLLSVFISGSIYKSLTI